MRTPLTITTLATLAAIQCAGLSAAAPAPNPQARARIIDTDLTRTLLTDLSITTDAGITGTTQDNRSVTFAPSAYLGLAIIDDERLALPYTELEYAQALLIELTDTQRVLAIITDPDDPDTLAAIRIDGEHPITIPLERVRSVTRTKRSDAWTTPTIAPGLADDAIRLINGDTIEGFITTIANTVSIETDGEIRDYPLDQIETIILQNPPERTGGTYVLTNLLERLRVSEIKTETAGALFSADPDDPDLRTNQSAPNAASIVAIEQIPTRRTLLNLGPPTRVTPSGDRPWAPRPTIEQDWIPPFTRHVAHAPSPVSMSWDLPSGAARVSFSYRPENRALTNNTLRVSVTDASGRPTELWSRPADHTSVPLQHAALTIPPGSTTLTITIDPGTNGPLQDQYWFRLPLVLVDAPDQSAN